MDVRLLMIDPQYDFCNEEPRGALFVPGAPDDCIRTAAMIRRLGKKIHKIYATFDSHSQYQIFHQMFWMKADGSDVDIFSAITNDIVKSGSITPRNPAMLPWALSYTAELEAGGKYPLLIWPYHCLIGTIGWTMDKTIMEAVHEWERLIYRSFKPITKGSNYMTEHYSAVKAEVIVPEDPTTQLNDVGLITPLEEADMVLICGQARSHCLANTVRDIMINFSDDSYIKKLYIIEDATSDVDGYEHLGDAFINDFVAAGGNLTTSDRILA